MEKRIKFSGKRKRCIVQNCDSHLKKQDVSHHVFPKNEEIKRKWIALISTEDFIPKVLSNSTVCSEHFDSSFKKKLCGKVYLTPDALPNFDSEYLDKEVNEDELMLHANEFINEEEYDNPPSTSSHLVSEIQKVNETSQKVNETSSKTGTLQIEPNAVKNIIKQFKKEKSKTNKLKTLCKKKTKNLKVMQQRRRRNKKKLEILYKQLAELEQKKLIASDINKMISSSLLKIIDSL
ncbi:THAP domain-containing protein 6-like [Condylostylus longicornis]|uniref:THAP domain-containing protein 6-like n=1 Tax=Condylostylus longicornis TaxID=2530218 RepID=UPI00244E2CC2|nr:THAP domain-containing protein 6-like [Condylostylus longicornis]